MPSPKPGTTWLWSFPSSCSSVLSAPSSRRTSTDKFSQCSSTFWILSHWLAHNFEETNYTFITRMRAALYFFFFKNSPLAWLFQTPIRFEMWTKRSRVHNLFWQILGMESLRLKKIVKCSLTLRMFRWIFSKFSKGYMRYLFTSPYLLHHEQYRIYYLHFKLLKCKSHITELEMTRGISI